MDKVPDRNFYGGSEEIECYICKKVWKRKERTNWVHHKSIPDPTKVVCRCHPGVREWYDGAMKDRFRFLNIS